MPHVDLLVELRSILAGVIAGVFVGEVALRWGASRTVALSAGLSIFAIPQIFWAALSCKDDLIMTAGLLCALYNAIASFSEPRRALASVHGGAAAVAAALVCATKVPGLVFGGSFIVLFALFLLRMRLWNRFWIVTIVFAATSLPAYAIQYIHNLQQYGGLFAESFVTKATWGGRWVPPAFESAFVSSIYYFLKLLFFEAGRGVGPRHDQSNYGIWFSLVVLPLAAVTNWSSILATLRGKLEWSPKAISKERLFVAAYMFLTMVAVLSRHRFTTWDQRFTIWVCPLLLVLGMHAATQYISPLFFRILCVGFTLMTVRSVLAVGFLGAAKTSLFGTIEVQPDPNYLRGYEAIYDARAGDTVLYLGGENTAEYPCWGWKYDRTVWVGDTKASLAKYFERLPDWVVLEEVAREDLRLATLEFLAAQHYRRVSQDVSSQLDLPINQRRTIWRR